MPHRWKALLFAPLIIAGLAACNFIIGSKLDEYGPDCKFEGSETACGSCIATNCGAQLNVICSPPQSESHSNLSSLESCAKDPTPERSSYGSSDPPCQRYALDGGSDGAPEQNLAVCVRDKCIQGGAQPCAAKCEWEAGTTTTCGQCIATKCTNLVNAVCGPPQEPIFTSVNNCALDPDLAQNSSCKRFSNEDGGPMEGTTDETRDHNLGVCIRDNCMFNEAVPPCRTCELSARDHKYPLNSSKCGRCIESRCMPALLECCDKDPTVYAGNQLLQHYVGACGFPDSVDQDCRAAFDLDAGVDAGCKRSVPDCLRANCAADCL